jgi:hypothetical protein
MSEFETQYDAFNLTEKLAEQLKALSTPTWNQVEASRRVVVETVVVQEGNRRVINEEITHAKLV